MTELLLVKIDLKDNGPVFSTFPSYSIPGQAQNVFILDAPRKYLAAYVCIVETDCIGLFCQLDWSKDEYIFIDTNIPYVRLPSSASKYYSFKIRLSLQTGLASSMATKSSSTVKTENVSLSTATQSHVSDNMLNIYPPLSQSP